MGRRKKRMGIAIGMRDMKVGEDKKERDDDLEEVWVAAEEREEWEAGEDEQAKEREVMRVDRT